MVKGVLMDLAEAADDEGRGGVVEVVVVEEGQDVGAVGGDEVVHGEVGREEDGEGDGAGGGERTELEGENGLLEVHFEQHVVRLRWVVRRKEGGKGGRGVGAGEGEGCGVRRGERMWRMVGRMDLKVWRQNTYHIGGEKVVVCGGQMCGLDVRGILRHQGGKHGGDPEKCPRQLRRGPYL